MNISLEVFFFKRSHKKIYINMNNYPQVFAMRQILIFYNNFIILTKKYYSLPRIVFGCSFFLKKIQI